MTEPNEFEIAGRATKMYHLIRVLKPVLRQAAGDGRISDLCARLDDEAWDLATEKAGVNEPSPITRLAIIEHFRQLERIESQPPVTSEQIAGPLAGEKSAAPTPRRQTEEAPAVSEHPFEADHAAHSPTPSQDSIFDTAAALAATDEAIERAGDHADGNWSARALEAVRRVALRKSTFIVDEVWHELGEEPAEPRAMGAVMRRAADAGIIIATADWQASERVTAHRNPRKIWQSLIVRQVAS
jgi:hypothetical protein